MSTRLARMSSPRFLVGMELCFLPAADGSKFHIQDDVFNHFGDGWDGAIFHPTCTFLTISAEWAYKQPDFVRYPGVGYHQRLKPDTLFGIARRLAREQALAEFELLLRCRIPRKAIENPRGVVSTRIRPPNQTIQPYDFGDDASKATCLWLEGWPELVADLAKRCPGRLVEWPRGSGKLVERWSNQTDSNQNKLTPSDDRWATRSKTYPGIAGTLAEQWAPVLFGEMRLAAE
ncbi:hypothetical protein [Bradyrhizobium elkanii]|uniref:hypothetical protein n=1 Tax=Bradyrhizobium elkanii TaxID=29448 RepID=UPI0004B8AA73|nr:hypothetical protein [Bradyrhizobium elkanii]WLA79604.1 hypothetical protein QNJ99_29935 [Bradyrhizobium elkanii]